MDNKHAKFNVVRVILPQKRGVMKNIITLNISKNMGTFQVPTHKCNIIVNISENRHYTEDFEALKKDFILLHAILDIFVNNIPHVLIFKSK